MRVTQRLFCLAALAATGALFGCGGSGVGPTAGFAPASLAPGSSIAFVYGTGSLTAVIKNATQLSYRVEDTVDGDDNGTADFTYTASGSASTFVTSNIVSFIDGAFGSDTWTMTWTSAIAGTGTDSESAFTPPAASFGYSTPGAVAAPSSLRAGQDFLFEYDNPTGCAEWVEASSAGIAGSMRAEGYQTCASALVSGTYDWGPSGATASLTVTVTAGLATYNLTFTTARTGTFSLPSGQTGSFAVVPVIE